MLPGREAQTDATPPHTSIRIHPAKAEETRMSSPLVPDRHHDGRQRLQTKHDEHYEAGRLRSQWSEFCKTECSTARSPPCSAGFVFIDLFIHNRNHVNSAAKRI